MRILYFCLLFIIGSFFLLKAESLGFYSFGTNLFNGRENFYFYYDNLMVNYIENNLFLTLNYNGFIISSENIPINTLSLYYVNKNSFIGFKFVNNNISNLEYRDSVALYEPITKFNVYKDLFSINYYKKFPLDFFDIGLLYDFYYIRTQVIEETDNSKGTSIYLNLKKNWARNSFIIYTGIYNYNFDDTIIYPLISLELNTHIIYKDKIKIVFINEELSKVNIRDLFVNYYIIIDFLGLTLSMGKNIKDKEDIINTNFYFSFNNILFNFGTEIYKDYKLLEIGLTFGI